MQTQAIVHDVVLPGLAAEQRPEAVMDEAGASPSAFIGVVGAAGIGKSVWGDQLGRAAEHRSRSGSVRWRIVRAVGSEAARDEPYAVCNAIIADAGGASGVDASSASAVPPLLAALERGLSSRRRLLLVIDDAQWIDAASLSALRAALPRLAELGSCTVLIGRELPHELSADLPSGAGTREIRLGPLTSEGLREYVSRVHGVETSLGLAERMREASAGVPETVDRLVSGMAAIWAARARARPEERARFDEDISDEALRLDPGAASASGTGGSGRALDAEGLNGLLAAVDAGVRERRTDDVFREMLRAIEETATSDRALSDTLVVELYAISTELSALPRMFPLVERLEAAPESPLRDLALFHVREFKGEYAWAAEFGDALLRSLPQPPGTEDGAWSPSRDEAEGLAIRMQVLMVLGIMAPQARAGDYGLAPLRQARAIARLLAPLQRPDAESSVWGTADRRLRRLPTAHDVLLRTTGMLLFGESAAAQADPSRAIQVQAEVAALGEAIATAPADTPTLFDARVIRAGVFSTIGFIAAAAHDLSECMSMLAEGTGGWGTGTARAMHVYCRHLLGDTAETRAALDEGSKRILDDMDAVGRPAFYAMRAVVAAERGDEQGWAESMRAAAQTTATGHDDTLRAEYEAWARIAHARLRRDPAAVLAVFEPGGPLDGRVLRSQNLFAFRIDAFAALGRAEEADRELARLRALPMPGFQPVHGSLEWLDGRVSEAYGHTREAIRSYRAAADAAATAAAATGSASSAQSGLGALAAPPASPAVRARAALDAGRLMLAVGADRRAARRYLRSAQRAFREMDRTPEADRATALLDLSRSGRDTRTSEAEGSPVAGFERLTAREREIAAAAARGSTNAEIAREFSLSGSTVAFHISNALQKLGLSSRRGLAALAVPQRAAGDAHGRGRSAITETTRATDASSATDAIAALELLTPRQREVAALAARDLSNAEIADALGITPSSVGFHMSNVLGRLQLSSRRELRRYW